MTLNDLKAILASEGYTKVGRKFHKQGPDYRVILCMDIAPTLSVHRIMVRLERVEDFELMADFALECMFSEDRFYIDNSLRLKDKNDPEYKGFQTKFADHYLPTIDLMTSNAGIGEIFHSHMEGKGLITWKLRADLKVALGWLETEPDRTHTLH